MRNPENMSGGERDPIMESFAQIGGVAERDSHVPYAYKVSFSFGDMAVTTIRAVFFDKESGADLAITHMTTLPESETSSGYGTEVVKKILTWAVTQRFRNVVATGVSDPRAETFWKRNGFVKMPEPNKSNDYIRII